MKPFLVFSLSQAEQKWWGILGQVNAEYYNISWTILNVTIAKRFEDVGLNVTIAGSRIKYEYQFKVENEIKNAASADILIAQYLTHFLYSTSLSPALSS